MIPFTENEKNELDLLCEKGFRYAVSVHSSIHPKLELIDLDAPLKTYFPISEDEVVEPGHEQLGRILYVLEQYVDWAEENFKEELKGKSIRFETHYPEMFDYFKTLRELFDTVHSELLVILKENGAL